jgi:adenylate kinase family enzyme
MKKIIIIGSGGAGKSTLARRLGDAAGLPVIHLDALYWKPHWTATPKEEWRRIVEREVEKESWIMDGNYGGTMEIRLAACDAVVFLDFPRIVCVYRIFKRWLRYRNRRRPDVGEGCREQVDLEFFHWVWNFRKRTKPAIEERLNRFGRGKTIIRLRSPKEVEAFLKKFDKMK